MAQCKCATTNTQCAEGILNKIAKPLVETFSGLMHIRLSQTIVLSSQNKNFLLKTTFPDYLGQNHHRKSNFEKLYAFFDLAQAVQSFST